MGAANPLALAELASTVRREGVQSPLAPVDARQKGGASIRRLSRLHPVGVRVQMYPKDRAPVPSKSDLTSPCELGAGIVRRPFHLNSHRFPVLPRLSRSGSVCPSRQARAFSPRLDGSNRHCAQSLSHQQFINAVADGSHVSVLSSSLICWINKWTQARTGKCHFVTGGDQCTPL